MEKYICPLCKREAVYSTENYSDRSCISCLNPNCLGCTTGWNNDVVTKAKWNKYSPMEQQEPKE